MTSDEIVFMNSFFFSLSWGRGGGGGAHWSGLVESKPVQMNLTYADTL